MPLDAIEQNAKTLVEVAYNLRQQNKKDQEKTRRYILGIAEAMAKDLEEERKNLGR